MKTLLIDAYDSFVYIIRQYLLEAGLAVDVVRKDAVRMDDIRSHPPDFIVLGPGPGHPADAGYVEIINAFKDQIPLLGICLGHQAIGLAFGGEIERATHLMHGKISAVDHDGLGCFSMKASPLKATRYHSLIISERNLPPCLKVTARSKDDGYIMGVRHAEFPIEGLQFHPESVCTEGGAQLFTNFVRTHVSPGVVLREGVHAMTTAQTQEARP